MVKLVLLQNFIGLIFICSHSREGKSQSYSRVTTVIYVAELKINSAFVNFDDHSKVISVDST